MGSAASCRSWSGCWAAARSAPSSPSSPSARPARRRSRQRTRWSSCPTGGFATPPSSPARSMSSRRSPPCAHSIASIRCASRSAVFDGRRQHRHLATHHAGLWCARRRRARLCGDADFHQGPRARPRAARRVGAVLWRQYEATGIASNLFNLPTVAYSGGSTARRRPPTSWRTAMARERAWLRHLIGPKTGHSYHAETKGRGHSPSRGDDRPRPAIRNPRQIWFHTYALRYPESALGPHRGP